MESKVSKAQEEVWEWKDSLFGNSLAHHITSSPPHQFTTADSPFALVITPKIIPLRWSGEKPNPCCS
jgi:hypothetical protein